MTGYVGKAPLLRKVQDLSVIILANAADIIRDETRWSTWCMARDKFGRRINPIHPEASQWSAAGAICRAYADLPAMDRVSEGVSERARDAAMMKLANAVTGLEPNDPYDAAELIGKWANDRPHAEVIAAFDALTHNQHEQ